MHTDTLQLSETDNRMPLEVFPRNSERAKRQLELRDIRVIIGNPPWSASQRSQNDNNPNVSYKTLDESIAGTYAEHSQAKLKQGLYDSYSRAIRWASNRILKSDDGGIIGFVTNGSYIDGQSFDGFRKTVASEFQSVYCYNLRGNARTSGETRRREAGSVFGGGTRAGVAVLLLVKHPERVIAPGTIRYCDIGDHLTREQKLASIDNAALEKLNWTEVTPDEHGDWINQQSPGYLFLRPLVHPKRGRLGDVSTPIFKAASYGLNSGRDAWVYNSSEHRVRSNVRSAVEFFNQQVDTFDPKVDIDRDPMRFSWDRKTQERVARKVPIAVESTGFRTAIYRPFFRQNLYMDSGLNASPGVQPDFFPAELCNENIGIFVANRSATSSAISALAVDAIPDLHLLNPDGRLYPRFNYGTPRRSKQNTLLSNFEDNIRRIDNISPTALADYCARFGLDVTADHVFAYVYAVLHSQDYRERYATDLAKLLPRIPNVANARLFHAFAEAGQQLLDLHLGYESVQPYDLFEERQFGANPNDPATYHVTKMRFAGTRKNPDRSTLIYNDHITLRGIPEEAHDYIIGPRSALAWVMDRYQIKVDKASGIVNDPNDWATEHGNPRYILDLVKRIVTVSLETLRIVRNLPPLDEAP